MNMLSLCGAVRAIVRRKRVLDGNAIELCEDAATNRCQPILVRSRNTSWAIRLDANEHLPFLEELPKEQTVRGLPDYLLFAEPPPDSAHELLRVVIAEIKSSEIGAASAMRQVQLGKFLAEYLLRVARFHLGQAELSPKEILRAPVVSFAALIVSPDLPTNMVLKGGTRPSKTPLLPATFDGLCRMHVFRAPRRRRSKPRAALLNAMCRCVVAIFVAFVLYDDAASCRSNPVHQRSGEKNASPDDTQVASGDASRYLPPVFTMARRGRVFS